MSQNLQIKIASGEALDVRSFHIEQEINTTFEISVVARTENAEVDFDDLLGREASFTVMQGSGPLTWSGVLGHIQQEHADDGALATYRLTIVPKLWLLAHRRNHRMFQQLSEVEIVKKILGEWGIDAIWKLTEEYKKRKYRVQYGESDFAFLSRMLEDAGISYYFEQASADTRMVLDDAPHLASPQGQPIPYNSRGGNTVHSAQHFSSVELTQRVRPGKVTIRDYDYRKPATLALVGQAANGLATEAQLEQFHYNPGAFLYRSDGGGDTPVADDKGAARTSEAEGTKQAGRQLAATRSEGRRVAFTSNAHQLWPGVVYDMKDHPRTDLCKPHLVVSSRMSGNSSGDVHFQGTSVATCDPFYPTLKTEKPRTQGVESATVVGPAGSEIHCDEFGRVRVQFHWDREGQFDDNSSIWIHVNQPWGGAGYGATSLPRVGQEVLVDFLAGDPDRPVITGRVYTALQTTPYKLPASKTQSGWKSNSTGGGGGYNEIKFEDLEGQEVFSTQAQRDHVALVKNDSTHTTGHDYKHAIANDETRAVGNDRSTMVTSNNSEVVGGSHTHQVAGNHAAQVGGNKSTQVGGNQRRSTAGQLMSTVGKDALNGVVGSLLSMAGGQRTLTTAGDFATHALTHSISSETGTTITVGSSMIHIGPDSIVIQSPQILLNPGTATATNAAAGGSTAVGGGA